MAAVQPGTIISGSWRYRLTLDDVLWAARMVEGETIAGRADMEADALAVLWTMTQLFSPEGQRAKYGRTRFSSFTALIRAYSQPINPRWTETGQFCRPGGSHHGQEPCASSRLAARARLQVTPWSDIDPALRRVVIAWATGKTRNPVPKAIEFAADYVARSFVERNPGAAVVMRLQNTFVATAATLGWMRIPHVGGASYRPRRGLLVTVCTGALLGIGGVVCLRGL